VCVTGILFSWNIENRVKEFFAFFLTLIAEGVRRVYVDGFVSAVRILRIGDHPKYFVIAIWAQPARSTRNEAGAVLFRG